MCEWIKILESRDRVVDIIPNYPFQSSCAPLCVIMWLSEAPIESFQMDQVERHLLQFKMFSIHISSQKIIKCTNQIVFDSVFNCCKQIPNGTDKSWEIWLKQEKIYCKEQSAIPRLLLCTTLTWNSSSYFCAYMETLSQIWDLINSSGPASSSSWRKEFY